MLRQELSQIQSTTDSTTYSTSIHTRDATTSPPPDDDATYTYDTHNTANEVDDRIHLTQELNQARKELTKFRKEMDGLSAQLNDMASEMVWISINFEIRQLRSCYRWILVQELACTQNDLVMRLIFFVVMHHLLIPYLISRS